MQLEGSLGLILLVVGDISFRPKTFSTAITSLGTVEKNASEAS